MKERNPKLLQRDIEAIGFCSDEDYDVDEDSPELRFRPDLIVNGIAALVVGSVTSFVIYSLQPSWLGFVGWLVIGTPCCLIAGVSSILSLLSLSKFDPFFALAPSLRCDLSADQHRG